MRERERERVTEEEEEERLTLVMIVCSGLPPGPLIMNEKLVHL